MEEETEEEEKADDGRTTPSRGDDRRDGTITNEEVCLINNCFNDTSTNMNSTCNDVVS